MENPRPAREVDRQAAQQVLHVFLRSRALPPQLKSTFTSINRCHAELLWLGFRLHEKRQHYGGPRMADGRPVAPMLLWTKGHVLVRIKPRGEPATGKFRQGLAHMSVCLLDGRLAADGRLDTSFAAEIGKFDCRGQLVAKTPGPATAAATSPWLAKSAAETWSDDTHFVFPDLVCDDGDVDAIGRG